ncbi:MAG: hypothetical protein RL551_132 [Pseudomonadota bacterium]
MTEFRDKAPWYGLLIFIVLVVVSAIGNNEQLLNNSQTLAFGQFQEKSHNAVQRDCSAELLTNAGTYLILYKVINDSGEQSFFQRLFAPVDYSISLESVKLIKQ